MSELEDRLSSLLSSPESMEQIMSLAKSLGLGADAPPEPSAAPREPSARPEGSIDPKLMSMVARLMGEYGRDDGTGAFLRALRPFLREEKRAGVDMAMEFAKIAKVASCALSEGGGK